MKPRRWWHRWEIVATASDGRDEVVLGRYVVKPSPGPWTGLAIMVTGARLDVRRLRRGRALWEERA